MVEGVKMPQRVDWMLILNLDEAMKKTQKDLTQHAARKMPRMESQRTKQRSTASAARRRRPRLRWAPGRRWAPPAAPLTCSTSWPQSWWPGRWLAWRSWRSWTRRWASGQPGGGKKKNGLFLLAEYCTLFRGQAIHHGETLTMAAPTAMPVNPICNIRQHFQILS